MFHCISKLTNFIGEKVSLLMSKSAEKWESCSIEYFLLEICLGAAIFQKYLIYSFICISLYFCVFEEFVDHNIEVEDQKLFFSVSLRR